MHGITKEVNGDVEVKSGVESGVLSNRPPARGVAVSNTDPSLRMKHLVIIVLP